MYQQLIEKFAQYSVLVIGDLMLDVYLQGASTRLTPEAPVPVVNVLSKKTVPGGGANTALNLQYLGASVTFCSIIGRDDEGNAALGLLQEAGIKTCVWQDKNRQTMVKTRVMAGNQLLVRYDSGSEGSISAETEQLLIDTLKLQYHRHDAVIIADYNKGLLTPAVINALQVLGWQQKKFIAIDSKRLQHFKSLYPSVIKPNYHEVVQLLGLPVQHQERVQQLQQAGAELSRQTGASIAAVTLDEEGALLFDGQQQVYRSYAHAAVPVRVAGAGDSYISSFTLACLAGADIPAAAELSSAAAAVAISKKTTACCTRSELIAYLSVNEKNITDLQQLKHITGMYKSQGKKIVFTNGCFDILHSGHVNYLNRARELGDVLMVAINSDESIRRIKGNGRPVNHLHERMAVLAGLGAVTHVIPFGSEESDIPVPLLQIIQPHVFVKGSDYTKEELPEAAIVEQSGGEVVLLTLLPDRSTTLVIDRIQSNFDLKLA